MQGKGIYLMAKKCLRSEMDSFREAHGRLGDRADWELRQMKKALSTLGGFFNDEDDTQRLKDVNTVLRLKKRCRK